MDDVAAVNKNSRPFTEETIKDIDRLAWVYKQTYQNRANLVCTRLLTGLDRCFQECHTCEVINADFSNGKCLLLSFLSEVFPARLYHSCIITEIRCCVCLLPGVSHILPCSHFLHESCVEKLDINVNGAVPTYKCVACLEYVGWPHRIYY